ncbi:hypothetical protein VUR80DRAFT_4667 [Thermomyces stellatus]
MKFTALSSLLVSALGLVHATPVARQTKAPYFFLIGDSTVAERGGWGNGLLEYLKDPAKGENRAVSGTTTVSWKSNGRWDDLLESVEANKDDYEPIITIQFGHNDQKGMELDEFQSNLESIVADLTEAGGTPILITSLTRRRFEDGKVIENLAEWAAATIDAAESTGVHYLDLNRASTDYINAIGEEDGAKYNLNGDDYTHLNPSGEKVFGRMTLDLLLEAREDLAEYFEENEALSEKIANGEYATGDE